MNEFYEGVFFKMFKKWDTTPIFKKGKKEDCGNY